MLKHGDLGTEEVLGGAGSDAEHTPFNQGSFASQKGLWSVPIHESPRRSTNWVPEAQDK